MLDCCAHIALYMVLPKWGLNLGRDVAMQGGRTFVGGGVGFGEQVKIDQDINVHVAENVAVMPPVCSRLASQAPMRE